MVTEIIFAAAALLLPAAALLLMRRMLAALGRIERLLERMAGRSAAEEPERGRRDAEQERYAEGIANILAYGTREMRRRGGEAQ